MVFQVKTKLWCFCRILFSRLGCHDHDTFSEAQHNTAQKSHLATATTNFKASKDATKDEITCKDLKTATPDFNKKAFLTTMPLLRIMGQKWFFVCKSWQNALLTSVVRAGRKLCRCVARCPPSAQDVPWSFLMSGFVKMRQKMRSIPQNKSKHCL